jgi:hypothetical protein
MLKKHHNLITIIRYFSCLFFLLIFSANTALALPSWKDLKDSNFGLTNTAQESGFNVATGKNAPTIAIIAGQIIGSILSFLGVIFMFLIIYSGFLWMTARGNEEATQKAKAIMINAAIGVAIIFTAYAATNLLIQSLYYSTASP